MNGNPPGIKELYEELCAENGTVPFCIAPEEAPQLFITEDPDRAWAELGEHLCSRLAPTPTGSPRVRTRRCTRMR